MLSRILAGTLMCFCVHNANAVVLLVDGSGVLTGATGVNISGTLFDVAFEGGTCDSVFNGCDPAEFAFSSESAA